MFYKITESVSLLEGEVIKAEHGVLMVTTMRGAYRIFGTVCGNNADYNNVKETENEKREERKV